MAKFTTLYQYNKLKMWSLFFKSRDPLQEMNSSLYVLINNLLLIKFTFKLFQNLGYNI